MMDGDEREAIEIARANEWIQVNDEEAIRVMVVDLFSKHPTLVIIFFKDHGILLLFSFFRLKKSRKESIER
jgi:hypothetical protein